jgi:hypothetical protein
MKRIAVAAAAAGAGLAMLIAVPAKSVGAPQAAPAEFEIAAPTEALGSAKTASAGAVYEPVRAPADFTMFGFRWNGDGDPGIAVRVSADGSEWGAWTPVPGEPDGGPDPSTGERTRSGVSAPIWAGDARYVQYRLAYEPDDLTLHFINTDALGSSRTAAAVDPRFVSGTTTGTTTGTTDTTATDPVPRDEDEDRDRDRDRGRDEDEDKEDEVKVKGVAKDIIKRKKWDRKNDCKPRRKSKEGEVDAVVIHHTVNANNYSKNEAADMVLGICRFHRNGNGWDDIGYNFVVDRFGDIYEGRNGGIERANIGAQSLGFNNTTSGIANLGDFDKQKVPKDALKAQAKLIQWLAKVHDFDPSDKAKLKATEDSGEYDKGDKAKVDAISGHQDLVSTDCPGRELYDQLKKLRKLAN